LKKVFCRVLKKREHMQRTKQHFCCGAIARWARTAAFTFCLSPLASRLPAQGVHFSQYYNTPLQLNPANAGLMPNVDYRVGAAYRRQWTGVPAPFRTVGAWGDFGVARRAEEATSWLGIGGSLISDQAGDGELSLTRPELYAAYHVKLGYNALLSGGLSGAYNRRTVDLSKLTFDAQWDGFRFDRALASREPFGIGQASYWDVSAGLAWAYFPTEKFFLRIGAAAAHLNQPTETFYGQTNQLGIRPMANVDALIQTSPHFIINPSAYYTQQKGAREIVYGAQARYGVYGEDRSAQQLILGAYNRWGDAVIGVVGYQWGGARITTSYDVGITGLARDARGASAFEITFLYEGVYGGGRGRPNYNCPRF